MGGKAKDADYATAFALKRVLSMSLSTCIFRGFYHKGACKQEFAVAHRGLGAGTMMPVGGKMRSAGGLLGALHELVVRGLSVQVPVRALGEAWLRLESELS